MAGVFALASTTAFAAGIGETTVAGKFNTLVGTLKGSGPFTVFAPAGEAFAELPAGTLTPSSCRSKRSMPCIC